MMMRVTQPMEREGLISSSAGVSWQASKSQVFGTPSAAVQFNTPKILELDVNRMMIGQTDVRYYHKLLSKPPMQPSFGLSRNTVGEWRCVTFSDL